MKQNNFCIKPREEIKKNASASSCIIKSQYCETVLRNQREKCVLNEVLH